MPDTRHDWRHQYDEERDELEGELAATDNTEASKTNQQFTRDANINEIAKRYGLTDGSVLPNAVDPKYYGDFSGVPDFRRALDTVREAAERFNTLPADIRQRFANSPLLLWQFVNDPRNEDEAVRLGLLARDTPAPPPTPPQA